MTVNLQGHIKEALWHIDAEIEKGGWDQRPLLLFVQHAQVADNLGAIVLQEIPGARMVIERTADMQDALAFLTDALKGAPTSIRNTLASDLDGLYGVALVTEAWLVREYVDGPMPDNYTRGDLSKHPDRVECRITHIVPVNGESAQLIHERDSVAYVREDMGGELPALLRALAQEFGTLTTKEN